VRINGKVVPHRCHWDRHGNLIGVEILMPVAFSDSQCPKTVYLEAHSVIKP